MRSAILSCVCALIFASGCALGPQPGRVYLDTPSGSSRLAAEGHEQTPCLFSRAPRCPVPDVASGRIRPADPAGLSPGQRALLRQVADEAIDSVVRVTTVRHRYEGHKNDTSDARATSTRSGGSGVVISADGLILTNAHVVSHGAAVSVLFHNGAEYLVESVVIDPRLDLAVLRIGGDGLEPLLPFTEILNPGTPVVAVAGPKAYGRNRTPRPRLGIVTATRCSLQQELASSPGWDYGDLVESTTKLEPGFSGGPLLDSAGCFLGLNVAATDATGNDRHRGYAIPFNEQTGQAIERLILTVDRSFSREH